MGRGTCTICFEKDTIIRKVVVASRITEQVCVPCANRIITFIEEMKKKNKKAKL